MFMKKKIIFTIVLIIIFSFFWFSLFYVKCKEEVVINIGEDIPGAKDFFYNNFFINNEIKWDSIIDSNIAGKYHGIVKYRNKKYDINLIIKDDKPPKLENVNDITVIQYEDYDLKKNISFSDNDKSEVKIEILGDYDLTKVGTYKLSYSAKDQSGNQVVKDFTLKVISEAEKNGNNVEDINVTNKGFKIQKIDGLYYVNGVLIANKTYPLPNTYNPGKLLNVFEDNYNKMVSDAKKEDLNIYIISAYRSYNTQKVIYENYASKDGYIKADTYSARAGHSEHQTGLAADVNSLSINFINTKEGLWLKNNCYKYGFIIRYVEGKDNITGYMYEPWHIRYVGIDLATKLYNNGDWLTIEEYFGITSKYN